jgi:hypothetical protein
MCQGIPNRGATFLRAAFVGVRQYVDWERWSPSGNGLRAAAIEIEAAAGFEAAAFGCVGMRNAFGEILGAGRKGRIDGVEMVVEIGRKRGRRRRRGFCGGFEFGRVLRGGSGPAFAAKGAATAGRLAIGCGGLGGVGVSFGVGYIQEGPGTSRLSVNKPGVDKGVGGVRGWGGPAFAAKGAATAGRLALGCGGVRGWGGRVVGCGGFGGGGSGRIVAVGAGDGPTADFFDFGLFGFACGEFGLEFFVVGDFAAAAEEGEDLIGVGVGDFCGEAALDEEKGYFGLEAVDFGGGGEGAGRFGEFGGGERGGVGLVGAAEGRGVEGEHAAAMAVGFCEGATIGIRRMVRFQLEISWGVYTPGVFCRFVKRRKMEEADSRQSTDDSLKRRTRREDNAEALRARRLAERRGGRLRPTVDSLKSKRGREDNAEAQRARRFAEDGNRRIDADSRQSTADS